MKLLLVEDSVKVRELTKSLFDGIEIEFVDCADGNEALAAYREHQPDWVLMDIQMPGMDGLTATRHITTAFPKARVLIVTQFDGQHLRSAASQAGARGYVLKEHLYQVRDILEAETRHEASQIRQG